METATQVRAKCREPVHPEAKRSKRLAFGQCVPNHAYMGIITQDAAEMKVHTSQPKADLRHKNVCERVAVMPD